MRQRCIADHSVKFVFGVLVPTDLNSSLVCGAVEVMGSFTYLLRKAARTGDRAAAWNLAVHYRRCGQENEYRRWIRKAAKMGDIDAAAFLNGEERALQFRSLYLPADRPKFPSIGQR